MMPNLIGRIPPRSLLSLGVILLLVVLGAGINWFVPFDPNQQFLTFRLKPPGTEFTDGRVFYLGTDQFGRDTLSRLIYGVRAPLIMASVAALIGGFLGLVCGMISGYAGGWIDWFVSILIDVQLSIPFIVVGLLIVSIFGASEINLIIVFVMLSWPLAARVVRANVRTVRNAIYVDACRVAGGTEGRVLATHILMPAMSALIPVMAVQVATFIIYEAAFGFLGLGVPPPAPTWGNMLSDARSYLTQAWWMGLFPGLGIGLIAISTYILAEDLHRALDPRRK